MFLLWIIPLNHLYKTISMNFLNAALDLKALQDHFDDERKVLVSDSLEEGIGHSQEWNIQVEKCQKQKQTSG